MKSSLNNRHEAELEVARDAAAKLVAADMATYSTNVQRNETKRAVEQREKDKAAIRQHYEIQAEVVEQRAVADFWSRPGEWTDQEYRTICQRLPPRPGS